MRVCLCLTQEIEMRCMMCSRQSKEVKDVDEEMWGRKYYGNDGRVSVSEMKSRRSVRETKRDGRRDGGHMMRPLRWRCHTQTNASCFTVYVWDRWSVWERERVYTIILMLLWAHYWNRFEKFGDDERDDGNDDDNVMMITVSDSLRQNYLWCSGLFGLKWCTKRKCCTGQV